MSKKDIAGLVGMFLLLGHMLMIAGDVQTIIDDPRQENKPGEILKLAFDLSRYFK